MTRLTILLFPVLLTLAACGGDKDGEGAEGADGPNTGEDPNTTDTGVVSVDIVAADGGTVAVGEATLDIPAGSLAADTTITAAAGEPDGSLPDYASIVGLVYDFGPDGTVFSPAATLELPLPVTPGPDEVAVMSWLDTASNTWVDLPSTVNGGTVSAPVEHFTSFVIRISIGGATSPGDCAFDGACGGDLLGTWNLDGVCLFLEIGETDTEVPDCVTVAFDADLTGTFTFNGDATYSADTVFTGEARISFVPPCTDGLTDCSQLEGSDFGTCTGTVATECVCTQPIDEVESATGRWSASGNTLSMDENETGGAPDDGPSVSEYCVTGSSLQLHDTTEGTVVSASR